MAKSIPDAIKDLMLANPEGDFVHVCSQEPATYTEAVTTYNLASIAITGGDYTLAAGDTNGRKNTLASPTGASITATGTGNHVAVTLAAGTVLKAVTTATPQALTSGGTVDIGSFDHELADVT